MTRQTPTTEVRAHVFGNEKIEVRALSFFEMLELSDLLPGIFEHLPKDREITGSDIAVVLTSSFPKMASKLLKIPDATLRSIPAGMMMEILSDFLELNITENFTIALVRLVGAVKQMVSAWPSISSSAATASMPSTGTRAGK